MKHLRISFNDQQLDDLSGLCMDLGKGMFLATLAVNYVLQTDFLTLFGFILGGMISVYAALWILERKKKKNASRIH